MDFIQSSKNKNILLFASYYLLLAFFFPKVRGLQEKKKKKEFKIIEMFLGVCGGVNRIKCARKERQMQGRTTSELLKQNVKPIAFPITVV